MLSCTSQNRLSVLAPRPAPETPEEPEAEEIEDENVPLADEPETQPEDETRTETIDIEAEPEISDDQIRDETVGQERLFTDLEDENAK